MIRFAAFAVVSACALAACQPAPVTTDLPSGAETGDTRATVDVNGTSLEVAEIERADGSVQTGVVLPTGQFLPCDLTAEDCSGAAIGEAMGRVDLPIQLSF